MDVTSFLSNVSQTFVSKYQLRARSVESQLRNATQDPAEVVAPGNFEPPKLDTVNISAEGLELGDPSTSSAAAPTDDAQASPIETNADDSNTVNAADDSTSKPESNVVPNTEEHDETPEAATSTMTTMRSNLNIRMKMQFSMRSIAEFAQRIENGETTSMEQLKQASFGLKADFRAKGMTRTEIRGGEEVEQGHGAHEEGSRFKMKSRLTLRRAAGYQAQGADFSLRGFFKENLKVRESLKVQQHGAHRVATHKFEMRYKFDSRFNIELMSKFNAQTEQVAAGDEANLSKFLTQAGNVAETGTTQMMASFFGTVDSYLSQAEDQMLANADAFLTAAQSEMGEGFASLGIKELITSRIESFFDAVDTAVTALKTMFIGQEAPEEQVAVEDVVATPDVTVIDPPLADEEPARVFA